MILQDTGWTAIFFATKNDRVDILKQLLLYEAKPELEVSIRACRIIVCVDMFVCMCVHM